MKSAIAARCRSSGGSDYRCCCWLRSDATILALRLIIRQRYASEANTDQRASCASIRGTLCADSWVKECRDLGYPASVKIRESRILDLRLSYCCWRWPERGPPVLCPGGAAPGLVGCTTLKVPEFQ